MNLEVSRPESIMDLFYADLPETPCWITNELLPKGGLFLAGGFAKIGKTFLAVELARALSTANDLFGCRDFKVPRPAKVLYIEQELGKWGFQKRVKQVLKEQALAREDERLLRENFMYISKEPKLKFDSDFGRDLMFHYMDAVQPNVLIVDPMGKMHGGDENDSRHIESLMDFTEVLRKDYESLGLSIIILHHFGKPPSSDRDKAVFDPLNQYNFRGSSKWFDAPDTIMTVCRQKNITNKAWQAWDIQARFITRHGEEPPDVFLTVNRDNDLRVRFERYAGALPKLEAVGKLGRKPKEVKEAEQLELP